MLPAFDADRPRPDFTHSHVLSRHGSDGGKAGGGRPRARRAGLALLGLLGCIAGYAALGGFAARQPQAAAERDVDGDGWAAGGDGIESGDGIGIRLGGAVAAEQQQQQRQQQQQQRRRQPAELYDRVCGSPAVGGYAHINATCLRASPTAAWGRAHLGVDVPYASLVAHIEHHADFDGLAVVRGRASGRGRRRRSRRSGRKEGHKPRRHS